MECVPTSLDSLKNFVFDRLLNEDPLVHSLSLLGTLPRSTDYTAARAPAIVRIEKTALSSNSAGTFFTTLLRHVKYVENNDIYTWLFGWFNLLDDAPDVKINIIFPATEVHIQKYSKQHIYMFHETPEIYRKVVQPYIDAFPSSRTQWVEDILSGKSEAHKILHKDPSPAYGYIILPDMKWDLSTVSCLYLVAISFSRDIRSLRDLRKYHVPMLRSIRKEASRIVAQKWGLENGTLRLYVHYQPSYYHFHVHIVRSDYVGFLGMGVGQAHLLDDIISLLELDSDIGPSVFERMTITYGLGEHHGLFKGLHSAQVELSDDD